jgi:sarcosine oxidase gamma subunit
LQTTLRRYTSEAAGTRSASIEIVGKNDCEILGAVNFAAKHWSTDEVSIHIDGEDARRVIEHAFAHNLNIANAARTFNH